MGDLLGPTVYFPPFVWERRGCQESGVSEKAAVSSAKRRRLTWKRDQTLTLSLKLRHQFKAKLQRWRDAYFHVFNNSGGSEESIRSRGVRGCDEDPPDVSSINEVSSKALLEMEEHSRSHSSRATGAASRPTRLRGDSVSHPDVSPTVVGSRF